MIFVISWDIHEGQNNNTWHTPIKFILYIVAEFKLKIYIQIIWQRGRQWGWWGLQLRLSCHNWVIGIRNIAINRKNIHDTFEIKVSINSNLNFTMWVFVLGLAKIMIMIYIKNMKKLQNISLCLFWSKK